MKINILYPIQENPFGGANQFLKAIRQVLRIKGHYVESPNEADIILFNSSPLAYKELIPTCIKIKNKYPEKYLFNRIDGPIFLCRGQDFHYDKSFFLFDNLLADGTIYQSDWSKENCQKLGMKLNNNHTTILNGTDTRIFFKNKNQLTRNKTNKFKIIATSWSNNMKKGFEIYQWLDKNLDLDKYEMTFVGNSPIRFKNIKHIAPLTSSELGNALRNHHLYLTASKKDPCSNALIEALSCGLPAIALNDGGHPEIIKKAGEVFSQKEDILFLLDKIQNNYTHYTNNLKDYSIEHAADKYITFFLNSIKNKTSKKITLKKQFQLSNNLVKIHFEDQVINRIRRLKNKY